jgi:hypothetical protein
MIMPPAKAPTQPDNALFRILDVALVFGSTATPRLTRSEHHLLSRPTGRIAFC